MGKLRVGAVNYLNTKPLIQHLSALAPDIDLIVDVPSQLACDLQEGRLDIGLIPSVEYFRGVGASIIPGVSISSYGPVMSVKVCSRVPFDQIRRMALDEGSRTSIALTDILLHHLFDTHPTTEPLPLHRDPRESTADAVLTIGDRAMKIADGDYPFMLDLGYEWSRWTGLPFVFAFWVVADGVDVPPELVQAFVKAKEMGRAELSEIGQSASKQLGLDEVRCHYYLQHVIRHDFGSYEMAGLMRFYNLAVGRALAPEGVSCVFYGSENFAESR